MNIDRIASETLQLSSQDRAILAETIWASLEAPFLSSDLSDKEAIVLAKQRDDEIERGVVVSLFHKKLMNRPHESK